ncbi:MAG: LPS assembly lipoprotein LptE [Thermoanaerobaculia bacterium]|nr:LPS assembly lipoprotein LptE [Thermoanaerobaculia bacterium]
MKLRLLPSMLLLLATFGCGYALVGKTTNLPEDVRNVFVQTLENRTTRAQVDQILTRAIADEFVTRQRFNVVPDRGGADAVLSGAVTNFRVRPVTFGGDGRATEYEILISASMDFRRTDDDDVVLWSNPSYLFREIYELDVNTANFIDTEDQAIIEVAAKFAETMVIDLLEGF